VVLVKELVQLAEMVLLLIQQEVELVHIIMASEIGNTNIGGNKNCLQQRFQEMAKYVVNSRLSFARNLSYPKNIGYEVRHFCKPRHVKLSKNLILFFEHFVLKNLQ